MAKQTVNKKQAAKLSNSKLTGDIIVSNIITKTGLKVIRRRKKQLKPVEKIISEEVNMIIRSERLSGVDKRLVEVVEKVGAIYPILVIEGLRSEARQRELVAEGKSKTLDSKHLVGKAVDIAPFVKNNLDWNDYKSFYFMIGMMVMAAKELGVKIRSGADWDIDLDFKDQTFDDLVHFELVD